MPIRIYHLRGLPLATAVGKTRILLRATETLSCALADEVVCVGSSLREEVVGEGLCPAEKISVLANGSSNGVDAEERFSPARRPASEREDVRRIHGISADSSVVLFVGRLVRDKGIVELADAWAKIRRNHPDAHLLLAGPVEARDSVPQATLDQLHDDPRVHRLGFVEETAALYNAADLVVLPTHREGFPNVPLEAAAMERPVVATRVTGCVDAVSDGETGTLVPAGSSTALADAISRYLRQPELAVQHGKAGRVRVLADFQPKPIWENLDRLYQQHLGRSTGEKQVL